MIADGSTGLRLSDPDAPRISVPPSHSRARSVPGPGGRWTVRSAATTVTVTPARHAVAQGSDSEGPAGGRRRPGR
eukprot:136238-Hanusia_phi.AAC.1